MSPTSSAFSPHLQFTHNVEQRAKYADEPQRFLESEIELDEAVRAMTVNSLLCQISPSCILRP